MITSQNTLPFLKVALPCFSSLPRLQVQAKQWMKTECKRKALFVVCCFAKGGPLPTTHPSALTEVCMLCFNRWAGWRLQGCKTGTRNLHWMVLNWMLIKFMDIYCPRQTRQSQTCLHTQSPYTSQLRGFISVIQGKLKAEIRLCIFLPLSPISFTQKRIYAHPANT